MLPAIIILVVVVVVILFIVGIYNGLVTRRNRVDEATHRSRSSSSAATDLIRTLSTRSRATWTSRRAFS